MGLGGCRAVSVLRDFFPLNSPSALAGQKESQVLGDEKLESMWASQGSGSALLQLHPPGLGTGPVGCSSTAAVNHNRHHRLLPLGVPQCSSRAAGLEPPVLHVTI